MTSVLFLMTSLAYGYTKVKRDGDKTKMKTEHTTVAAGVFAAMNFVGAGVALFLACGYGGDPIAVLCQGIQVTLGVSFGTASLLFNLLIIGIALLVSKKNLGVGTVAYALVSGYFIDFYSFLLKQIHFVDWSLYVKIICYFVGIVFLAETLSILLFLDCGMNGVDAIVYFLEEKLKSPYQVIRTTFDVTAVLTGFLLGGTVGWGTLICALATGTLVKKLVLVQKNIFKYRKIAVKG